jgi:hypothetical protein
VILNAKYPDYDGTSPTRDSRLTNRSPDNMDFDQIVAELLAHQAALQNGSGNPDGIPVSGLTDDLNVNDFEIISSDGDTDNRQGRNVVIRPGAGFDDPDLGNAGTGGSTIIYVGKGGLIDGGGTRSEFGAYIVRVDGTSFDLIHIDSQNFYLNSPNGTATADFASRQLYDNDELSSIDWNNRQLYGADGGNSLDWSVRNGSDSTGNLSFNWDLRTLTDNGGVISVHWQDRQLLDQSGGTKIIWDEGGVGFNNAGTSIPLVNTDAVTSGNVNAIVTQIRDSLVSIGLFTGE